MPGLGSVLPPLLPPGIAVVVVIISANRPSSRSHPSPRPLAPSLVADLLNMGYVRALGTPLVAISGAGTFDAIFPVGVIAVQLATI